MSIESILDWLSQRLAGVPATASALADAVAAQGFDRMFAALLLPPASPLLLVLLGLACLRRWPRTGRTLAIVGVLAGWLFASNTGANWLAVLAEADAGPGQSLASLRAAQAGPGAPQAVVILGGGLQRHPGETPMHVTVKPLPLERLVHGAWVARSTRLPVLVTGGIPRAGMPSEAAVMARTLESTLGIRARWIEGRSRNTRENAEFSAEILKREGITRIVLVTQAYHMPRAVEAFRRAGLSVLPAPHGFAGRKLDWEPRDLLPTGESAALANRAAHELLGRFWYRLGERR